MVATRTVCYTLLSALTAASLIASRRPAAPDGLYRGAGFELGTPAAHGWRLVSDPRHFAFPAPPCAPAAPSLAKWKVVELAQPDRGAVAEVYLVRPGRAKDTHVAQVLLRKHQRRRLVEGKPARTLVGGRRGNASIAVWRPTPRAVKHCFYVVQVPVGDALWCFVGSVPEEHFDTVRWQFRHILNTVKFAPPTRPARRAQRT